MVGFPARDPLRGTFLPEGTMSEALAPDLIQFDDTPRPGIVPEDGTAVIGRVLKEAGVDVPCTLYNEAIDCARDGHLGQAMSRLQMLLCLDPDDADAHLLLAKVHAAQNKPTEALARLEAATQGGAVPPAGFRDYLEAAIRAERSRDEEQRARVAAREVAEVRALRAEARQLRSDNVRLETEVTDGFHRERLWKYATIGASVFGSLVILVLAFTTPSAKESPPAMLPETETAMADVAPAVVDPPLAVVAPPVVPVAKPVVAAPIAKPVVAAPVVAAPVAKHAGAQTHVVASGDTLYKIAKRYYGDATKWEKIQSANPGKIKNGKDLTLGTTLTIP